MDSSPTANTDLKRRMTQRLSQGRGHFRPMSGRRDEAFSNHMIDIAAIGLLVVVGVHGNCADILSYPGLERPTRPGTWPPSELLPHWFMLRLSTRVAVIAGVLAASTLGTVGITTGVASAAPAAATCKTLTTTGKAQTSSTGKLSGCTPTTVTGGSAKVATTQDIGTGKGSATITWSGGKGTTTSTFTFKLNPKGSTIKCASGDVLVQESSTTTGGTNKKIPKGQKSTLYLCANTKSEATSLAPGQKYSV
jgi:hypothetical protein